MPGQTIVFEWLLRTSAQAAVLVCLILTLQALLKDRLAPKWRWALWAVLVVRLVLPWTPESRASVFNLANLVRPSTPAPAAPVAIHTVAVVDPTWIEDVDARRPVVHRVVSVAPPISLFARLRRIDWGRVLPLAWLGGVLVLSAFTLANGLLLSRWVRGRDLSEAGVLETLEACKERLGIRAAVAVVESPLVKSPALLGLWRPRIVLPLGTVERIGLDGLRYVFMHELAHLKRHDISLNWLMSALQFVHWFNPLIWYGFYRMRADRELACDALVLSHAQPGESKGYGETIVALLEGFAPSPRVAGMVGILEGRSQLRRRITMIARFEPDSHRLSILAITVMALLAIGCLTNAQSAAAPKAPAQNATAAAGSAADTQKGAVASPGGTAAQYVEALSKPVTVSVAKSPDRDRLTVQYAVIAISDAAGVPYQWDKSQKLGGEAVKKYINPVNVSGVEASWALNDIVKPLGLVWCVEEEGLYLNKETAGVGMEPMPTPEQVAQARAADSYIAPEDIRVIDGQYCRTITATIRSKGLGPVGMVDVYFYVGDPNQGGRWIGRSGRNLVAGNTGTESTRWDAAPGIYQITAVIHPAGEVSDTDKRATATVRVSRPYRYKSVRGNGAAAPVDVWIKPDDIKYSDIGLGVLIHAKGEGPIPVPFEIYRGDPDKGGLLIRTPMMLLEGAMGGSLGLGGLAGTPDLPVGTYDITVVLDPNHTLTETDTTNNRASRTITVEAPANPNGVESSGGGGGTGGAVGGGRGGGVRGGGGGQGMGTGTRVAPGEGTGGSGGTWPAKSANISIAPIQPGNDAAESQEVMKRLERRITSFDFNNQPFDATIMFLRSAGDVNIVLDPRAADATRDVQITAALANARLEDILDLMTTWGGLEWIVIKNFAYISDRPGIERAMSTGEGGIATPIKLEQRAPHDAAADPEAIEVRKKLERRIANFDFNSQPFDATLAFLRSAADVSIIVDPTVAAETTVTMQLQNATISSILTLVTTQADLDWTVVRNYVYVSDRAGIAALFWHLGVDFGSAPVKGTPVKAGKPITAGSAVDTATRDRLREAAIDERQRREDALRAKRTGKTGNTQVAESTADEVTRAQLESLSAKARERLRWAAIDERQQKEDAMRVRREQRRLAREQKIADVWIAPEDIGLFDGDYCRFVSATIHNNGQAAVGPVDVDFYVGDPAKGGKLIGRGGVRVEAGKTATEAHPWDAALGAYQITAVLDPEGKIAETDKTNNRATATITIKAPFNVKGDVKSTGTSGSGADNKGASPKTPDDAAQAAAIDVSLTAKDITLFDGDFCRFLSARINGRKPGAAGKVDIDYYLGDPAKGGRRIYQGSLPLATEGAEGDAFPWDAKPGKYEVFVVLDPERKLNDPDRSNNTASATVTIAAPFKLKGIESTDK